MPSHLANWMKEEKRKIKERNKSIDEFLASKEAGKTINFYLSKGHLEMKKCKDCMKGKCKKHGKGY